MRELQTVIWDLDGTLINSFSVFAEVLSDVLQECGRPVPSREMMSGNFHGTLAASINGALGGALGEADLKALEDEFIHAQETHYEVIEHHLFDDAVRLARRLHEVGARQLLVTNRDHANRPNASPRSIVANSELSQYIQTVICGDDSEHRKPKPEVLGDFVYNPAETLVVGDQFVDAQFAYNIGARAVLVSRNGGEPPHLNQLKSDWQSHVALVSTLDDVRI